MILNKDQVNAVTLGNLTDLERLKQSHIELIDGIEKLETELMNCEQFFWKENENDFCSIVLYDDRYLKTDTLLELIKELNNAE